MTKTTTKKVSLDQLKVDPRVQRVEGLDERRVQRMVAAFKPHALGSITVSDRNNGKYVVLDGMHRTAAARQAGYRGLIPAQVISGLSLAEEAELFNLLNDFKAPSAMTKFRMAVLAGEPDAVAITETIESHGWRADLAPEPGCIAAVTALQRVYRNGAGTVPDGEHPEILDRVLSIITAAWDHDTKGVHAHLLLGVAALVGRFGPSLDDKKLVAEMQDTQPGVLVGKAKTLCDVQGGTVGAALAKILVGMHNKKRRTNLLPEWVWTR